ncbi:hypothetical protein V8G54_036359 [Vigna mungo]|uniref:BED-type domain-containing protein n=1 Tax=Vigna mungo TaxID=3915 RepID=A0AAQ3MH83_VIGMU
MDFTFSKIIKTLTLNTYRIDHLPLCITTLSIRIVNVTQICREHFTKQKFYYKKKPKCNYCSDLIKYFVETSGIRNHLMRCKENPNREIMLAQLSLLTTEVMLTLQLFLNLTKEGSW